MSIEGQRGDLREYAISSEGHDVARLWSPELVKGFVSGTWLKEIHGNSVDPAHLVYGTSRQVVVNKLMEREYLPEIGEARLALDFLLFQESRSKRQQVMFVYLPTIEQVDGNGGWEVPYAQMHLDILSDTTFELVHRYVEPHWRDRGLGLGTRLWKTTELWLQDVAQVMDQPVKVTMGVGQKRVMRWAEKMKFEVVDKDREMWQWIKEEPEAFVEATVNLSSESRRRNVQKSPYLFPKTTVDRYQENAVRLTYQKIFLPS